MLRVVGAFQVRLTALSPLCACGSTAGEEPVARCEIETVQVPSGVIGLVPRKIQMLLVASVSQVPAAGEKSARAGTYRSYGVETPMLPDPALKLEGVRFVGVNCLQLTALVLMRVW